MEQKLQDKNKGKDIKAAELERVTAALDVLIQMDLATKNDKEVTDGRYNKNSTTDK